MELMLKQDVQGVGTRGQIVTVADGYARNYLLPKKLAVRVSSKNVKFVEMERRKLELRGQRLKAELAAQAEALSKLSCTIVSSATPEGHLFGSVSAEDIARALAKEEFQLSPELIQLPKPIKEVGVYQVSVKLGQGVETSVKVWVIGE